MKFNPKNRLTGRTSALTVPFISKITFKILTNQKETEDNLKIYKYNQIYIKISNALKFVYPRKS